MEEFRARPQRARLGILPTMGYTQLGQLGSAWKGGFFALAVYWRVAKFAELDGRQNAP